MDWNPTFATKFDSRKGLRGASKALFMLTDSSGDSNTGEDRGGSAPY